MTLPLLKKILLNDNHDPNSYLVLKKKHHTIPYFFFWYGGAKLVF